MFPLSVDPSHRFLTDASGLPFFYAADTQWLLFWAYTLRDAALIIERRASTGFTALQVSLLPFGNARAKAVGAHAFANASTLEPNEAYFTHAEAVLDLAEAKGLAVYLVPLWYNQVNSVHGAYGLAVTEALCASFGSWLGRRWRTRSNLLFAVGGDFGGDDDLDGHDEL